jgi:hypothetical protein
VKLGIDPEEWNVVDSDTKKGTFTASASPAKAPGVLCLGLEMALPAADLIRIDLIQHKPGIGDPIVSPRAGVRLC